jgi:carbon storage regulator CsrA
MLVLSRRKNQKVLFPSLGISIQVVRANPKNIQLGIEAPKEIRVIRAELAERPSKLANSDDNRYSNIHSAHNVNFCESTVRRELEEASLAIRLAQNQVTQGLNESAERALDHALSRLQALEEVLLNPIDEPRIKASVREQNSGYHIGATSQVEIPSLASIVSESFLEPLAE